FSLSGAPRDLHSFPPRRSSDLTVHLCQAGAAPEVIYHHAEDAHVAALSRGESLIAIGHSEHGDSRHMALRVVRPDGATVADLWRSEEHTSELQSRENLVCRLLL